MGPALPAVAIEAASHLPLTAAVRSGAADAAKLIRNHLSPAVAHSSDFIADHGKGSYVWSSDGTKHLDMTGGIGVSSTGHCHPKIVKAIQEQAALLVHTQQNIFSSSVPMAGLIDRLLRIMPSNLQRFFFANSGSEVVDNAIKVARGHTGKQNIIAFENSFHGRTFGAMALTNSKVYYRQGFGPLMGQTFATSYPYCLHCKVRQAAPDGTSWYKVAPNNPPVGDPYSARVCCQAPLDALEWLGKQQSHPEETAAIIIEPILGEGGFLTPPPGFLDSLRAYCTRHNIVLIIDEVQSGVARTGKWWGHQHLMEGQPDIMIFAKGIASGFPFAGLAVAPHMFDGLALGTMGGTYGGNPLGCATACATLDLIEEEGLLQNATDRGLQLQKGLVELAKKFPISDVRGRGLMVAIEFGGEDGSLTPRTGVATAVTKAALKRNMLLLTAGARESVRFLPPLTVSADEINEALEKLEDSLTEVFSYE